jgi:hypothetical protein
LALDCARQLFYQTNPCECNVIFAFCHLRLLGAFNFYSFHSKSFFRYIVFAIHFGIHYIYVLIHTFSKNNVSKKSKCL